MLLQLIAPKLLALCYFYSVWSSRQEAKIQMPGKATPGWNTSL